LEIFDECIRFENSARDDFKLLLDNHYFSSDLKPEIITKYFNFLENKLDTHNYRVSLIGDFNVAEFDWERGVSLENCHFYSKLKWEAIYASTFFLGESQLNVPASNGSLLDSDL
jgi:hypothetical protein